MLQIIMYCLVDKIAKSQFTAATEMELKITHYVEEYVENISIPRWNFYLNTQVNRFSGR